MFETTALESRKKKGGLRKLLTLPISVGLHALVVGIVVFINLWAIELPTNPPAQVPFETRGCNITPQNRRYMDAKRMRARHLLDPADG